jgi:hypothetical protein
MEWDAALYRGFCFGRLIVNIANQKFLKSKLVTKQSKHKLYKTVIRPVVIYASEA